MSTTDCALHRAKTVRQTGGGLRVVKMATQQQGPQENCVPTEAELTCFHTKH